MRQRQSKDQKIYSPIYFIIFALIITVITATTTKAASREIVLSREEQTIIALINQERVEAGLPELKVDPALVELAREKSRDMVLHNYFGHISERLGSVYQQLEQAGIIYQLAAENLIGASGCQKAHQWIMASPAHSRNILNPHFARIGVGIIRGGPYGAMITQFFLN